MEISKKDLLKEIGISYGQLYRWKREGLIPESWFVKRPSPTGQETYFPKERILNRIRAIQQMKDTYSLEELAKMLTPEVSNRMFTEEDLEEFSEIDIEVAALFMDVMEKDCFSFYEILVMMVISEWNQEYAFSQNTRMALIQSSAHALTHIHSHEWRMLLVQVQEDHYVLALQEPAASTNQDVWYWLDERMKILRSVSLQELSSQMKVKYKETFAFTFDEEVVS